MGWLDRVRRTAQSSTLGKSDIPWWVGLVLLLGLVYLSSVLPSELKPLSVLGTVPRSGATGVPADTVLVVHFGTGGFEDTFGELDPVVVVRYEDQSGPKTISTTVTYQGDVLRAVPVEPLPAGKRVEAAVRTQFDRDLVWNFWLTNATDGPRATPLPEFR